MISIVIPTFNEVKNIIPLLKKLRSLFNDYEYEIIIVDDFNMVRVQCKIEAKQDILINEGYEETETEDGKEPTLFFPNSTDERELHEGALDNSTAKLIRDNEVIAVLYIK